MSLFTTGTSFPDFPCFILWYAKKITLVHLANERGFQDGWFADVNAMRESWADTVHYQPKWTEFQIGKNNLKWESVIDHKEVLMSPSYIKLDLMKQFIIATYQDFDALQFLKIFSETVRS